ncbi:MAG: 4Fe-4S double cluster binding domain-containing protein [Bacillota bacterium]
MPSPRTLLDDLRARAHDAGLEVGVSASLAFTQWREAVEDRPEYAPYRYMAQEYDARRLLPEARSLVAVAYDYGRKGVPSPLRGHVARLYFTGVHLGYPKSQAVRAFESGLAARGWGMVPFSQAVRPAAIAAGLVHQRVNCLAYRPRGASLVSLHAWAVDAEIEPTEPLAQASCGECSRCVEACPTGAILEPYHLDPRRCLDFLATRGGRLPLELRSRMGGWILGCDACQEACPHNRHVAWVAPEPGLEEASQNFHPATLLLSTPREFDLEYKDLLAGRLGHREARRNAAVALGNLGAWLSGRVPVWDELGHAEPAFAGASQTLDTGALVSVLGKALEDPEPLVRSHVAWALGQVGSPKALSLLEAHTSKEQDVSVLDEVRWALQGA